MRDETKSSFFKGEKPVFWLFFACYLLLGLAFVFLSKFWADENWYFGGSWLVANGELPYRDFFIHHNPLVFYVYALPQYFFGPNIIVGRLTSLLIMMLIFLLVWRLARKLGDRTAALIAGGLLITHLFTIYYFTTFSYRALEACLMLVFFTILLGNLRDSIKYPLATLILCLVVGVRYPIDFASGLLVLYLAYVTYRSWKKKKVILLSLSVAVLSLGVVLLPFILLARDQFLFGTVAFNFLTPSFWVEFGISGQPSLIDRLYHIFFIQSGVFQSFYAIVAILFALLFYLILRVMSGKVDIKELIAKNCSLVFLLSFIILFEIFGAAAPQSTISMRTITLPATIIVAGAGLAKVLSTIEDRGAIWILYGLVIGLVIVTPFAQYAQGNEARPTLTWQKTEMKYVIDIADKIADYTDEDDKILTFTPTFALQANRALMPGTTMELFAFFPTWETEKVKKRNLLNLPMLLDYLSSREAGAVVLTEERFFSGRYMGRVLDEYRVEILQILEENYYLVEKLSYPQEIGRGSVYIYLPRQE